MLNEPITAAPATAAPTPVAGAGAGMMPGGVDPRQLNQMLSSLGPQEQAQLAASMGMTPEMLQQVSQMMSQMPPEQMQQLMSQMGGAGGMPGAGGGMPGGMPGQTTIQLTEEEAAAVNRLCDMGFGRQDALQAYLACEKNEALAANFLMDSMDFGGNDSGAGGDMYD